MKDTLNTKNNKTTKKKQRKTKEAKLEIKSRAPVQGQNWGNNRDNKYIIISCFKSNSELADELTGFYLTFDDGPNSNFGEERIDLSNLRSEADQSHVQHPQCENNA